MPHDGQSALRQQGRGGMSSFDDFGQMPDGRRVERITLKGGGLTVGLLTMGATVQDLRLDGFDYPLVLGAETLAPYLGPMVYFGAIVGRFANRIAGGRFNLEGRQWQTNRNQQERHTLHGGEDGLHRQIWRVTTHDTDRVNLVVTLPDGHMGFPGRLHLVLDCALPGDGVLAFEMSATTDAPTLCNLAHHGYFNLDGSTDICDHTLQVAADHYLPVDSEQVPTGEICAVRGTRFDFRLPRAIGDAGIDHNLCLSDQWQTPRRVATLSGPRSGIAMEITTNACGLQVYDGAHLSDLRGHDGRAYGSRAGVALETQGWPDAPNHAGFPPAVLRPGQTYRHSVRYRFIA